MRHVFALMLFTMTVVGCSAGTTSQTTSQSDEPKDSAPKSDVVASEPGVAPESNDAKSKASDEPNHSDESKVFVIDVRSKAEWDTGHVQQATHIPHTELGDRISEVTDDKSAKIVLYCASGGRAGRAKTNLEELGYTNVENAGGYDDVKDRFDD